MATKSKSYQEVKFNYEVINKAYKEFLNSLNVKYKKGLRKTWEVQYADSKWELDSEAQFVSEYVKEDILEASFWCYGLDDSKFSVSFSNSSHENPKTRVTISLPDREKIEKVFGIFETDYNNFLAHLRDNTKDDNSKILQVAPRYSFGKTLPSTLVEKRLLVDLERYILQRASQLDTRKTQIPDYSAIILDSSGTLSLKSIETYPRDIFDNEIEYITLSYGGSYENIKIYVRFGKSKDKTEIEISYKGENAREIVGSIREGIFQRLKDSKTWNAFYHPHIVIWSILVNVFIIGLGGTIYAIYKQGVYSQRGIAISALLLVYIIAQGFKPYTTFDTRRNEKIRKWSGWLVESILGILLIWLVSTLFPTLVP